MAVNFSRLVHFRMYLHQFSLLCLIVLTLFSINFSQDTAPTPVPTATPAKNDDEDGNDEIRITTDLVTLTLTVQDQFGRYVSGLGKNAFTVIDNNQEQELTFFSDTDAPVSVGILFDVSDSMSGDKINKARKALERFINTSHPNDEYFLIAFNSRAQLLLDRTRNGEQVLAQLQMVKPKHNTALYDAVYLGVERVTRGSHQKKVLLIISDGQDNSSRYNFGEVRRLLKESDVVIYSVGIVGGGQSTLDYLGRAFLNELSSVTGGQAFYPNTSVEMDEIFERIATEMRYQYSVGYTPKDFKPDGKWRKVKVKVKPQRGLPRLTVRSREGYYATPTTPLK